MAMTKHGILMTPDNAEKCYRETKTVTRLLIKQQPPAGITGVTETVVAGKRTWCFERQLPDGEWEFWHARPPYFRHDIVAIAETHWAFGSKYKDDADHWRFLTMACHKNPFVIFEQPSGRWKPTDRTKLGYHKRPAIFLPYDLARTYWEILDARPERLQDISEEDAVAEGCACRSWESEQHNKCWDAATYASKVFSGLWDSINARRGYPFDSNPWVWRLEGRKVTL